MASPPLMFADFPNAEDRCAILQAVAAKLTVSPQVLQCLPAIAACEECSLFTGADLQAVGARCGPPTPPTHPPPLTCIPDTASPRPARRLRVFLARLVHQGQHQSACNACALTGCMSPPHAIRHTHPTAPTITICCSSCTLRSWRLPGSA